MISHWTEHSTRGDCSELSLLGLAAQTPTETTPNYPRMKGNSKDYFLTRRTNTNLQNFVSVRETGLSKGDATKMCICRAFCSRMWQQKIFLLQSLERDDSPCNTVVGSYMATRELVGKKRGGKKAMDAVAIVTYHLLAAGSWRRRSPGSGGWSCPCRPEWTARARRGWTSHRAWPRWYRGAGPPRTARPWGSCWRPCSSSPPGALNRCGPRGFTLGVSSQASYKY